MKTIKLNPNMIKKLQISLKKASFVICSAATIGLSSCDYAGVVQPTESASVSEITTEDESLISSEIVSDEPEIVIEGDFYKGSEFDSIYSFIDIYDKYMTPNAAKRGGGFPTQIMSPLEDNMSYNNNILLSSIALINWPSLEEVKEMCGGMTPDSMTSDYMIFKGDNFTIELTNNDYYNNYVVTKYDEVTGRSIASKNFSFRSSKSYERENEIEINKVYGTDDNCIFSCSMGTYNFSGKSNDVQISDLIYDNDNNFCMVSYVEDFSCNFKGNFKLYSGSTTLNGTPILTAKGEIPLNDFYINKEEVDNSTIFHYLNAEGEELLTYKISNINEFEMTEELIDNRSKYESQYRDGSEMNASYKISKKIENNIEVYTYENGNDTRHYMNIKKNDENDKNLPLVTIEIVGSTEYKNGLCFGGISCNEAVNSDKQYRRVYSDDLDDLYEKISSLITNDELFDDIDFNNIPRIEEDTIKEYYGVEEETLSK